MLESFGFPGSIITLVVLIGLVFLFRTIIRRKKTADKN